MNISIVRGEHTITFFLIGSWWLCCFIRKGKDYTYLYGSHVGTGSLTPFIDSAFDSRIDRCGTVILLDLDLGLIIERTVLFWMVKCSFGIQFLNEIYHLGR